MAAQARTRKSPKQRAAAGRNVELGKIHIGATALGLIRGADKDGYYTMLWSIARVKSAAELDHAGRRRVLEHLRAAGWDDPGDRAYRARAGQRRAAAVKPQAQKIRSLWLALAEAGHLQNASESGLRAYVQKQSAIYDPNRHGYSAPELLPSPVAQRVIEHLKQWCRRTGTEI